MLERAELRMLRGIRKHLGNALNGEALVRRAEEDDAVRSLVDQRSDIFRARLSRPNERLDDAEPSAHRQTSV
jgi:LytS/YehU family sensor histidine kinase